MLEYLKKQKYKTRIGLVELTKLLEREPCDSISFTHKISKRYANNAAWVPVSVRYWQLDKQTGEESDLSPTYWNWNRDGGDLLYISPSEYITLYAIPMNVPKLSEGEDIENTVALYEANGNLYYRETYQSAAKQFGEILKEITRSPAGDYRIVYNAEYVLNDRLVYNMSIEYNVKVEEVNIPKPIPSITDVLNRILDVGVPRAINQPPKYRLDPVIAEKFKDMPAPEFFLPRLTLYEALLAVGGYIHAIPKLIFNEETKKPDTVTFTLLGMDEVYTLPQRSKIVGFKYSHKGDAFCGALDSYVDNMINTIDPTAGSIVEPFDGGWKTTRCEGGVKIDNETAVIATDKPIYRIVKVEMGFTDGEQTIPIGDITKYVYEQAEYDGLLTADTASYPNSVAYALCYKQGSRYITGLNTASTALLNFLNNFKKPSIENIVNMQGKNFGDTLYANLAFRVTYIPIEHTRVRQYKPYTGFPNGNVIYNQQNANTVEANYYGENLKGKISRMGNPVEVYSVLFAFEKDLPKIGQIFENQGYIFKISRQRARNYVAANIYVTPDFNRLSEYVGLNSNFRLYEVSERQSIDRNVMVPRIITFGDRKTAYLNLTTTEGAKKFMQAFNQDINTPNALKSDVTNNSNTTVAVMGLYSQNGELIGNRYYAKAVSSIAVGNSLAFTWGFEDNYSAGAASDYTPSSTEDKYKWKQCKNVPYGSVYGEFYSMAFGLANTIYERLGEKKSFSYEDQLSTYDKQGFCDSLPVIEANDFSGTLVKSYFSTQIDKTTVQGSRRAIDKNSSEVISMTVQFHGQANRKSIVLGSKLWVNNPLVTAPDSAKKGKIYLLTKPLNMLRQTVDLTGAYEVTDGVENYLDKLSDGIGQITPITNPTANSYVAWAIVDPTDNGLYIGENMAIAPNGQTKTIYISFDEEA